MTGQTALIAGACVAILAFAAEYVDSTLGMGYGTTLTPVLLLMGYEPMQVVPAVLFSELLTGLLAGLAHHSAGNADFRPRAWNGQPLFRNARAVGILKAVRKSLPRHLKVALLLALCSVAGTLVAVLAAIRLSGLCLRLYIAGMVLTVGVSILLARRTCGAFSWRKITGLGLVASFNKGISGGGYGPVVTGGQILSGVEGRNAVAITSLAEGLTCAVAFAAYLWTRSIHDWTPFPFLCVGAVLSVPLSAYTVRRISPQRLRLAIGMVAITLGLITLGKAVL